MCHCWSICSPPPAGECKLSLGKSGENRNARLLPLSVASIAQLHDSDSEYSRLSICVPPTSAPLLPHPPHFTVKSGLISFSDPSHPPTHLLPVLLNSRTAVIGPSPHSLLCVIIPSSTISPCTLHCSGPGPRGRPAGCSPSPPSAPFWTFWTLPPFQLCSLGRLGATIVRRGSVRQGVTSHQRTTRGALTTSSEFQNVFRLSSRCGLTTCKTFCCFVSLPSLCPSDSWNSLQLVHLARINWAVYSVEKAAPAAANTALDDDIFVGINLLGHLNL